MNPYWTSHDGAIVLYHGDCLEVMPSLAPVQHTLTDPPYARDVYQRLSMPNTKPGSGTPGRLGMERLYRTAADRRAGKVRPSVANDPDAIVSIERLAVGAIGHIDEMLDGVAFEVARLTERWALVFSDVETCGRWRDALEVAGLRYVRTGAWVKTDPMPQFSGDRPAVGFEPCTIAHAQGPMRWNGGGLPAVWTYGTVKHNRPDHPCPKPIELMRKLVEQFTDPGELILDPFAGSATTLLAALHLGRRAIGIEVSEQYAEVAAKRLENDAPLLRWSAEQGALL